MINGNEAITVNVTGKGGTVTINNANAKGQISNTSQRNPMTVVKADGVTVALPPDSSLMY